MKFLLTHNNKQKKINQVKQCFKKKTFYCCNKYNYKKRELCKLSLVIIIIIIYQPKVIK